MLVWLEPVLHTSPRGFHLDDSSSSSGSVVCYAKEPRGAYTAMIIEFKLLMPRDEKKFAQLFVEAKEHYWYNKNYLGVDFPIIIIFRLNNTFHFARYNPNDGTYEFRNGELRGGENRPMVMQRSYRPPTICNICVVAECFYHFLIQSYIGTLEANDKLEQGTPSECSISLARDGLRQTALADFLCDKGLEEQADAMAEAGYSSLTRSCFFMWTMKLL